MAWSVRKLIFEKINHTIKVKNGKYFFSHGALVVHDRFIFDVDSRATTAASPDSVWGVRYQPLRSRCGTLLLKTTNNVKVKGGNSFVSPRARCPYLFLLLAGDRCQRQRQIQPVHQDRGVAYNGSKHAMVVVLGRTLQEMVTCRSMKCYSKYEIWYRTIPYSHHDVV